MRSEPDLIAGKKCWVRPMMAARGLGVVRRGWGLFVWSWCWSSGVGVKGGWSSIGVGVGGGG